MQSDILLVDDNPTMIQVMARMLSGLGRLRFATNGAAALQQAREHAPDLVLLDAEMPGMNGFQVCEAIKADRDLQDIAVIFVTSHTDAEFELKGLEIGAVDFIAKPVSEPLLVARVQTHLRLKQATDELRRIAAIDSLTEVANRRSFDESLAREWQRGLRTGDPTSLLMIDVDHFKQFNDRYGHPAGDGCLRAIAQSLRGAVLRPADIVARYGGEEFAVLLPQTPRVGAEHVAQRMLYAVEALKIPHETSPVARHVTFSIGIGFYDGETSVGGPQAASAACKVVCHTADELVRSADQALYCAKQHGRAQAWRLDIGDVNTSALAREIDPVRPRLSELTTA
jgi:diguanylate cyclase (GGDEF)-like protein